MNIPQADILPVPPRAIADRQPVVIRDGYTKLRRRTRPRKPSRLGAVLTSAITWLFGCVFTGAVVTVAGVFILAGTGWALIAVGVFLFLIAGLLRIGITHG